MTVSILNLGDDILISNIASYLSPEDIFKLFSLSKSLYDIFQHSSIIFQTLYNKKFTNNENNYTLSLEENLNWKQLFYLRCSSEQKFYTWGDSGSGRLGYKSTEVPRANLANTFGWTVHTPTNVSPFNDHIIVDIAAGGFSFFILTNEGELWFTGLDYKRGTGIATPGPVTTRDYRPNPGTMALFTMGNNANDDVRSRRNIRTGVPPIPLMAGRYANDDNEGTAEGNGGGAGAAPATTTPPAAPTSTEVPQGRRKIEPAPVTPAPSPMSHRPSKIKETSMISRLFLPQLEDEPEDLRIVSISAGREHIIALDNYNHIFTWDAGSRSNVGLLLEFPGIPPTAPVIKIVAGWNLSTALIQGYGLVVWYTRSGITRDQFIAKDFRAEAKYFIVPFSKGDIVDFSVGSDYVMFIRKSDQKLYQLRFDVHELASRDGPIEPDELRRKINPMDNFNNWREQQDMASQFTKLKGCFNNFVVFTNHDQVLLGNLKHLLHQEDQNEEGATPIVIDELQGKNIKTIEMGDYHYLALTVDGSLLSWGSEPRGCGCLGLGYKLTVHEDHPDEVKLEGADMIALHPMKTRSPPYKGKWVSIVASGWQSGGIYVPVENE
ncbi:SCF-associated factor 1 [Candida viswanathii]|uniref:SCF-associated factor 1 n=1 Tax=Candida viswanathii TaxID=5486 RepID=A0A367YGE1_9ASCO|nr:SCF-associated factor 1 [Candida viswanathii]